MSDQVAGKTFVKTGPVAELTMFEAEADGLAELRAAGEIRVPAVVDVGLRERYSFIELEFLDLERPGRKDNEMLGRQLARLHAHTQDRYGWFRDNTIGQTLQRNVQSDDWVEFFARYRLRFQLELAAERGHGGELADLGHCLLDRLPVYFEGYTPVASLLHGDLWGGNWASVRRRAGGIRSGGVLWRSRERYRHDDALRRLHTGFLRRLRDSLADGTGKRRPDSAIPALSRVESSQSFRPWLSATGSQADTRTASV